METGKPDIDPPHSIPFDYAYIRTSAETFKTEKTVRNLASVFRAEAEASSAAAKRNTNLISIRIEAEVAKGLSIDDSTAPNALRMLNVALGELPPPMARPAVHQLFSSAFVREICSSEGNQNLGKPILVSFILFFLANHTQINSNRLELAANVRGLLSETDVEDKELVQTICAYWSSIVSGAPAQMHVRPECAVSPVIC